MVEQIAGLYGSNKEENRHNADKTFLVEVESSEDHSELDAQ